MHLYTTLIMMATVISIAVLIKICNIIYLRKEKKLAEEDDQKFDWRLSALMKTPSYKRYLDIVYKTSDSDDFCDMGQEASDQRYTYVFSSVFPDKETMEVAMRAVREGANN